MPALDEQCAIVVPSNHRRRLYKRHDHADEKRATLLSAACAPVHPDPPTERGATTQLAGVIVASGYAATDRAANASSAGLPPTKPPRCRSPANVEPHLLTSPLRS